MKTFTKEQAITIRENCNHLIGKPFDDELKITNIWIIPIDQDQEFIMNEYQNNSATYKSIAETYGKGQNLLIQVYSSDLLHLAPILPCADITQYLTYADFDEILTSEEE